MDDFRVLSESLTSALAVAHAALDAPTEKNAERARRHADDVWPRIRKLTRVQLTLGQAEEVAVLVKQLRAVLAALDRECAASLAT
jgi:hypothetical protein